jgi:hypothetical protein
VLAAAVEAVAAVAAAVAAAAVAAAGNERPLIKANGVRLQRRHFIEDIPLLRRI